MTAAPPPPQGAAAALPPRGVTAAPPPQGRYRPTVRSGGVVYTAGMTPRRDGVLLATGAIGADVSLDEARALTRVAASNAVDAVEAGLAEGEQVERALRLVVYLVCAPGITEHSAVADAASDVVLERWGPDALGPRTAVGVFSLPGGAPCEVELTALVAP